MNGRDPVGWQRAGLPQPEADIVPTQVSIVHAHRRRRALDRLDGLTTGLTVAGVAGTAGFAILAAASWSGVPGKTTANDLPAVVGSVGDGSNGSSSGTSRSGGLGSGSSGGGVQPVNPNLGRVDPNAGTGSGGSNGTQNAPRVRPAQPRSGHATTGGSG
jgi:hypothetical protein